MDTPMNEWGNWTLEQKTQSLEIAINFITNASVKGNLSELQQLCGVVLERFDPDSREFRRLKKEPLEWAAEYGRTRCLQYLLATHLFDRVDRALQNAAKKGYWDCMEALIPFATPKGIGAAMSVAAYQTHWTCVRRILPFVDPTDSENFELCLAWSSAHKHQHFVAAFYTRCNPEVVLENARNEGYGSPRWTAEEMQMLAEYHSPKKQRERLNECVGPSPIQSDRKAKM